MNEDLHDASAEDHILQSESGEDSKVTAALPSKKKVATGEAAF